jgi:hypothetical protein
VEELKRVLLKAGFEDIVVQEKENTEEIIRSWNFGEGIEKMVSSAYVKARKPSARL